MSHKYGKILFISHVLCVRVCGCGAVSYTHLDVYKRQVLNWIIDCKMVDVFPNIYIAYRVLLTIPIANCESDLTDHFLY